MLKQEKPRKKPNKIPSAKPHLRGEELLLLYEIGRVVNSTLDLNQILQSILNLTTDIFKAEAGSIMLIDKHGELHIAAAQGLSPEIIQNTHITLGEGIAGWVAQTGEPLLLDGKVQDSRFKLLVDRKDDVKSSLCVPLMPKERIIGVLMLRNPTSAPSFTADHLRFLSAIADQAAIALEHARLYQAEQKRSAEIEAIISSMADGVIVTSPEGEIILVNPVIENIFGINKDSVIGKHFDVLFKGLSFNEYHAKVLTDKKPVWMEITLNKPTATIFRLSSTPMNIKGDTLGVVTLLNNITEQKQVNKMKSDVLSLVTHELKTPITSIQGFVEVVLAKDLPRERVVNYLTIVKQETARLVRLINNLLDLSKLEAGKLELKKIPVDIVAIIKENLEAMEQISLKHKFSFSPLQLTKENIPHIHADRDMIAQVINNLLSNAIKYSPEGGTITINVLRRDNLLEVSVSDEGIGIPNDKLPHLFERFYRVNTESTVKIKGTGLGLANAKYLIEQHGGTLRVKSTEGVGSTFTFTIPINTIGGSRE